MKRRNIALLAVSAALAVGVVGQVANYRGHPPTATLKASWSFHPQTVTEARSRAQSIVLGQVVSVQQGNDIVTQQPGEPGGVDRIPTRRITVKVLKTYKGTAQNGTDLTLFQTGGSVLPAAPAKGQQATTHVMQVVLEGDPGYRVGEQYLLMLEPGPAGTLRPISPEGRYRYSPSSGALTPMVNGAVPDQIKASRLTSLEPTLRAS
jgi:hypothetical protein